MFKIAERKSVIEPQRIQHELERQIGGRDEFTFTGRRVERRARGGQTLQIVSRLFGLRGPEDAIGQT